MSDFDSILMSGFNLNTSQMFEDMKQHALTDVQKATLATYYILEQIGGAKRTFSYARPLARTDNDCAPVFVRSFAHADWRDGEDVVSAEGSNGDEGFNARFHKIEADLDALSTDNSKMFECMSELRADLATLLEEIRLELNRINTDLNNLRPSTGGATLTPLIPRIPEYQAIPRAPVPIPTYPGTLDFDYTVNPVNPYVFPAYPGIGGGFYTLPMTTTLPVAGTNTTPATVWTSREDATIGIINGMRATRVNEGMFNGQKVELWNTPLGTVLTPVSTLTEAPQGYVDPRLETTGRVGGWAGANAVVIKDKFQGKAFTKIELEREFGEVDIGGGVKLKEAIKGVPAGTSFANAAEIVTVVAAAQATAIKDAGAATVASIGSVGIHMGADGPQSAAVELFSPATSAETAALAAAGIKTVGDLAMADPVKLAKTLEITAGSPDAGRLAAGRLQGIALAVGHLGR